MGTHIWGPEARAGARRLGPSTTSLPAPQQCGGLPIPPIPQPSIQPTLCVPPRYARRSLSANMGSEAPTDAAER